MNKKVWQIENIKAFYLMEPYQEVIISTNRERLIKFKSWIIYHPSNYSFFFKIYWNTNTNGLPYEFVFAYIKHVSDSAWYKEQKKLRRRFYFCLPKTFVAAWLKDFDHKTELAAMARYLTMAKPVKTAEKDQEPQELVEYA